MRRAVALVAAGILGACSTAPTASPREPPSVASATISTTATPSPSSVSPAPSPTATPAAAALEWSALTAAGPQPREDHTWTVADGDVAYLFGGRDGDVVHGDLWAYDLASDSWSEVVTDTGPDPRFGHEAVWVDGVGLVVFAGQAGTTFFNDLWAFDADAGTWRELPASGDVPAARYGTCAGIGPDGRLWISHGFTSDGTRFADTVAYDFGSATWTDETPDEPRPDRRCLHGCWWTGEGDLSLFGGQTTGVPALGDHWVMRDGAWARVDGALPSPRNLYARTRVGRATLVFGGGTFEGGFAGDAFLFPDGATNAVSLTPSGDGPTPRSGSEMVTDEARDRVLLFGGRDANGAVADLWQLTAISGLTTAD